MKRSRKIVGSIFLFLASIATSFAIESGLGFEALLNANPVATLFDANRTAIEIPSSGTSTPSSTKTATANLDPSDTFSNNVICITPEIQNHRIYVCSGVPFRYIPDNKIYTVPESTTFTWKVETANDNITGENLQDNQLTYFNGTTTTALINEDNQPHDVIYKVTPRTVSGGTCLGDPFFLTVTVEPAVTVVIADKTASPICSGDPFTVIPTDGFVNTNAAVDIVPANMKYTWVVDDFASVTGETEEITPKASISQTLINTSSSAKTVTYTVTPRYGTDYTCSGPAFQVSVTVNPRASIDTHPVGNTVCLGGTTPALSVAYSGTTVIPTYQWFINDDNSNTDGTPITTNGTSDSYTPPTDVIGTTYYYVELTFGTTGPCTTAISTPSKIEVVGTASITTQPEALKTICVGGTTTLTVDITGGTGTPTYQWYSSDINSNSGGNLLTGETADTFTPPVFTTEGDYYYYAVTTLTGSICGATLTSDVATVQVVADPVITSQPVTSQILCQGATPTNLTATIDGGIGSTATYQWFKNTTTNSNSGGTQITPNGTDATYTPPTT